MSSLTQTRVFNRTDTVVETWYWALPARELKRGQVRPLSFLGEELAIYRGEDGIVRAVAAYCPHMGAHLAEGRVDGKGLRCFFHAWKFDESGELVDIPCRSKPGIQERIRTYPVTERYGVIWIYTGETPSHGVHEIPELEGVEVDAALGRRFVKGCHPNVVMINAIDAHHFTSVHHLPVKLDFGVEPLGPHRIMFSNRTPVPGHHWALRAIKRFYREALTYSMCYTGGTTGSVSVGPDFLHFHIVFALRPTADGKTEGLPILLTNRRKGLGRLLNPVLLFLTRCVGDYFAKGDTEIFESIRFSLKRPIREDASIIRFIQHLETQKTSRWGFGTQVHPGNGKWTLKRSASIDEAVDEGVDEALAEAGPVAPVPQAETAGALQTAQPAETVLRMLEAT